MRPLRLATFLLICMFSSVVLAQKTKTVEATYTYHVPATVSKEEAMQIALDRAKLQAIAEEFGTIVQKSNSVIREANNGKTNISITSIGGSEVKGEWIETIGEPKYSYSVDNEQGFLIITCTVKGKAREIVTAQIDFKAKVLRNGTEEKFEDDEFRSGDDLYLSFQSPVKGNLAVYLVDADRQAFCLLPYRNQTDGIYPVNANQPYLFFNERMSPQAERSFVDEYTMTCERSSEHNQIYIIFSPNQFAKAVDSSINEGLPRQLSYEDFNKWLVKCRKQDKDMNLRMIPITITK